MDDIRYTFPLKKNIPLRPLRVALSMRREELAVRLGVTVGTIGRWERGAFLNQSARNLLEIILRERGVYLEKFLVPALPETGRKTRNPAALN